MKRILSLILLSGAFLFSSAQTAQVATLLHEGDIKFYYSAEALQKAYDEAADGDVITLSSGNFNAVNISKNITIRGAGMGVKNSSGNVSTPTVIMGDFAIEVTPDEKYSVTLEGLRHGTTITLNNADNMQIIKCSLTKLSLGYNKSANNLKVVQSEITDLACFYQINAQYINSVLTATWRSRNLNYSSSVNATNCILLGDSGSKIDKLFLTNCIIVNSGSNEFCLDKNSTATNCVVVGKAKTDAFNGDNSNKVHEGDGAVFVEDSFYRLSEEMKNYKGKDDTEVGIYGGRLPFSPATTNPQITKFNVASQTTADGKLSVDIEVKVSE